VQVAGGTPEYAAAAYLSRFPQSEPMFSFSDFSLFAIVPGSIRFVGGFAQATAISPDTLAEVLTRQCQRGHPIPVHVSLIQHSALVAFATTFLPVSCDVCDRCAGSDGVFSLINNRLY
jgi:hypothetical protein